MRVQPTQINVEQTDHTNFDYISFYLQNELQRGKKALRYLPWLHWKI